MTAIAARWFKRLVLFLAIIPILIYLAFLGAINFIDFNGYKPQIEKEISDYTQRDFKIEGSIDVSVLPLTFTMGKSLLSQPKGFDDAQPQLQMKGIEIELSMWALLLHKKLEVLSLEVIEPKLSLIKNKEGQDNWSDLPLLTQLLPQVNKPIEISALPLHDWSQSQAKAAETALPWQLKSLVINNAGLKLDDQQEDYQLEMKKMNLFALDLRANQPFEIRTDFQYQHSLSPRTVDFKVTGKFEMDHSLNNFVFSDWQGLVKVALPVEQEIPETRLTTAGKAMKVNLQSRQVEMTNLKLEGLNGSLETNLSGKYGANLDVSGALQAKDVNLPLWAKFLALPIEQASNPAFELITGDYQWRWKDDVIHVWLNENEEEPKS